MSGDQQPCALYRHFDEFGVLLYVGISHHPERRTGDHISTSAWVQYADRGSVEWLSNLSRALVAERRAIQSEKPIYNRQGSDGRTDKRIAQYLRLRSAYYGGSPERPLVPVVIPPPSPPTVSGRHVTLREAIAEGIVTGSEDTVYRAIKRGGFPQDRGRRGTALTYLEHELAELEERRARKGSMAR